MLSNFSELKVYVLSALLFGVSILHFTMPTEMLKVMPPFIPFAEFVITSTGLLEIILAITLIIKSTRYWSAIIIAIYFVLLLPVHIFMILKGIPLAGISNPLFLWGRALFQFILIYWAYSVRFVLRSAD